MVRVLLRGGGSIVVAADLLTFDGPDVVFYHGESELERRPVAAVGSIEFDVARHTRGNGDAANEKAYSVAEIRQTHPSAYARWTPAEDDRLLQLHDSGIPDSEIAATLGRQASAVRSRIGKLRPIA